MNPILTGCASPTTWTSWHSINWKKVEHAVKSLQTRIVKAVKAKHYHKVKTLLHLLTRSFYGKLLAIFRVTTNECVNNHKTVTQKEIIRLINPKIKGCAKFFRHSAAKQTFSRLDNQVFRLLWKWAR